MHLTLHLTNRCNLACRYCYAQFGQEDMSLTTAMQSIAHCARGPNCGIIFFGGEPLLRKELIAEIMAACEGEQPGRLHYKVTTNGLFLDDAFLTFAGQHRLHIALSHDGLAVAHDAFRVRPDGVGTSAPATEALQRLLAHRPYAPVLMTVNPETVDHYADSVRWLQAQGVQYLIASLNYAGPWTSARLGRLKQQYLALAEWHLGNYRREQKFYFSPFDKRIASRVFPERGSSCRLGKRQISVGPDGTLYPCVQFVGHSDYAIGHATRGLDEGRRDALFQRNERAKPCCAGCPLEGRCHNRCGCLNFQTTGRLDQLPPILCEHERILFPIVDELAGRLFEEGNALFMQRHYNPAFPVLSFLEDLSV